MWQQDCSPVYPYMLKKKKDYKRRKNYKWKMVTSSVMADSPTRATMCVAVHLRGGDQGTTTDPQVQMM